VNNSEGYYQGGLMLKRIRNNERFAGYYKVEGQTSSKNK